MRPGLQTVIYGAVLLAIGAGVTIWTYTAASGPSGGTYVLAWGPVIFGVFRIGQGLVQMSQAPKEPPDQTPGAPPQS